MAFALAHPWLFGVYLVLVLGFLFVVLVGAEGAWANWCRVQIARAQRCSCQEKKL
jgi:hypothetical protein